MNTQTILRLLLVLALLSGVAYWLNKKSASTHRIDGIAAGDKVFPSLDINAIQSLEFISADTTLRVARADSGWVLASRYNYPAKFQTIATFLRKLDDLKVGQVTRNGDLFLKEYGLEPESQDPDNIRITLTDGKKTTAFTFGALKYQRQAGEMGMGFPQGRFMRVADGPVLLISELFNEIVIHPEQWLERTLLTIPENDIQSVTVHQGESSFSIHRDENGVYKFAESEEEAIDSAAGQRLFQGLQSLRLESVIDPAVSDDELGLSEAASVTYRTHRGITYTLLIGKPDEAAQLRPLRLIATYEGEDSAVADDADRFQKLHAAWRYMLPNYLASQLKPSRDSLMPQPAAAE